MKHYRYETIEHGDSERKGPELRTTWRKIVSVRLQTRWLHGDCVGMSGPRTRANAAHGSTCSIPKHILHNGELLLNVRLGFARLLCESTLALGVE